jgi:uncharacterized membrane protein
MASACARVARRAPFRNATPKIEAAPAATAQHTRQHERRYGIAKGGPTLCKASGGRTTHARLHCDAVRQVSECAWRTEPQWLGGRCLLPAPLHETRARAPLGAASGELSTTLCSTGAVGWLCRVLGAPHELQLRARRAVAPRLRTRSSVQAIQCPSLCFVLSCHSRRHRDWHTVR